MWEDKSAQLCNAAKNPSLFPSSLSPPLLAGVFAFTARSHIYTYTIRLLTLGRGHSFQKSLQNSSSRAISLTHKPLNVQCTQVLTKCIAALIFNSYCMLRLCKVACGIMVDGDAVLRFDLFAQETAYV